jgi:hypothetical protein
MNTGQLDSTCTAPTSYATRSERAPALMPASATASVSGLLLLLTYGSMHCVSASSPVS